MYFVHISINPEIALLLNRLSGDNSENNAEEFKFHD